MRTAPARSRRDRIDVTTGDQLVHPGERAEHPDDCRVELRRPVEPVHPVPLERLRQTVDEGVGQAGPVDVEPLQEGKQVLLRAAAGDAVRRRAVLGPRAGRAPDLGEDVEQARPRRTAARRRPAARSRRAVAARSAAGAGRQRRGRSPGGSCPGQPKTRSQGGVPAGARSTSPERSTGVAPDWAAEPADSCVRGPDADEWRAGIDLDVGDDVDRGDLAGERRDDRRLHLHALEHRDRGVLGDDVARLDEHGDDERQATPPAPRRRRRARPGAPCRRPRSGSRRAAP